MRPRHGKSLTEDVYAALRRAVLHGELTGGQRLPLNDLARQYGVSLGVVREAVTRLASERLLEANPQSGFRVRPLSAAHLADLSWARCHVESIAISESVRNGDVRWQADVVGAHHVLGGTPTHGTDGTISAAWMDAHRAFHAALVSACPSRTLLDVRQQLFDEGELYRHRFADHRADHRDVAKEHHDLVDAAVEGDVARAAALLVAHISTTARHVELPGQPASVVASVSSNHPALVASATAPNT
jgi:GntR family transcriptional regulator, carbon starvation induced regulator